MDRRADQETQRVGCQPTAQAAAFLNEKCASRRIIARGASGLARVRANRSAHPSEHELPDDDHRREPGNCKETHDLLVLAAGGYTRPDVTQGVAELASTPKKCVAEHGSFPWFDLRG